METKKCCKCNKIKSLESFYYNTVRKSHIARCVSCTKEDNKTRRIQNREIINKKGREKRQKNPEATRRYAREYYKKNKEKIAARNRELYKERHAEKIKLKRATPEEKNKKSKYNKLYKKNNPEKRKKLRRSYQKRRRKRDPLYRLKSNLTTNIHSSITRYGYTKRSKTYKMLGADWETVKSHLENTWYLNYGTVYKGESVHIDHIIPVSSAKNEKEMIKLQHYLNLQYLTPHDNLTKSDKLD